MAAQKHTRARKPSTTTKVSNLTRKQLNSVGLANVTVHAPESRRPEDFRDKDDYSRFFRVPLGTKFEFGWEFDNAENDTEFLFATFDSDTLLQTAVNLGLLRETYEKQRRVPKGKLPAMQVD